MKTFGWTTFLTLILLTHVTAEPDKVEVYGHAKQHKLYKHREWSDKPTKHIKGERKKAPEDKIPHKKTIKMEDIITEYVGPFDETTTQVVISNSSHQPRQAQPTTNETIDEEQISDEPSDAESAAPFVVELTPFQLAFDSTTPINSYDMRLLQVTISHVSRTLNMTYEKMFDHVKLYYLVNKQDESIAKVSFGGWSYFQSHEIDPEQLKKTIWFSFFDSSQTSYIEDLGKSGFKEVTKVALYALDGRRVVVRDGDLRVLDIGEEPPDIVTEESSTKDRNVVAFALMIGVPSFVVLAVCLGYCWFEYTKRSVIPDVWKSSNNYSVEL